MSITNNYFELSDEEFDKIERTLQHEDYKYIVLEKIQKIYESVFEPYQKGELLVSDPYLFYHLTLDQFTKWAIMNNSDLRELFYPKNNDNH